MSALGQKQTFAVQNGMSALPPKADMCSAHVAALGASEFLDLRRWEAWKSCAGFG